ncbi:MAG: ArgE/DapE family deacylase [Bacteroidetes bacterium]|nr:ArgE/DapE family deacylase [Bacteroidota bacterium]
MTSISQKETYNLLSQMIRINSENPMLVTGSQGEGELARFMGKYMENMGLEVSYQDLGNNRVNAIGVLKGSGGGKTIMLNGHLDTVGIEGMTIDPLEPTLKDGKVFGRGSQDMKGGVAAMVMAVKSLVDAGIKLNGDVIITCVADEEYGSIGTEEIVKEYTADGGIVTEPTDEQIVIAHKGFVWSKITVEGKAAHGSRYEDGVDAIVKMGKVLAGLDELENQILVKKQHPLLGRGSVHASMIQGGSELSVYPSFCQLELERRILPGENLETSQKEIAEILERISHNDPAFKASFETWFERVPLEVDPNEAIVKSISSSYQQMNQQTPQYQGVSFWTDAAILAQAGIPTVIFGPKGKGLHAAVEYVELPSVVNTAEVIARTIMDFCAVSD